jgi:hypothetical protein
MCHIPVTQTSHSQPWRVELRLWIIDGRNPPLSAAKYNETHRCIPSISNSLVTCRQTLFVVAAPWRSTRTPGIGTLQRLPTRACAVDPKVNAACLSCAWPAHRRIQHTLQTFLGSSSSLHLGQTRNEGIKRAPSREPRGARRRRRGQRLRYRVRARTVSLKECCGQRQRSPCTPRRLMAPEPGQGQHFVGTPLMSFVCPSSDIATSPGLPRGRTAALDLSQVLDGLQERWLARLVSCGRRLGFRKSLARSVDVPDQRRRSRAP